MTTAYALVAPLRLGEDAKRVVRSLGIGRRDLKVGRRGNHILIPLQQPIEPPFPETSVEVAEFQSTRPPRSYKEAVKVPDKHRSDLPTSFDVVGDLVLIKIPEAVHDFGPAIGEAILRVHKNVKAVFHDDGVEGPFRIRQLKPLAGERRTVTTHTEFGVKFHVDLARAYFSPRLANEHHRVAQDVKENEIVVDATAGVGPFAMLIAKQRRAKMIHAIDANPDAVELLKRNVEDYHFDSFIQIHQGDAAAIIPTLEAPDRVIVNLPHAGEDILSAAAMRVKSGGRLHYFRVWPQDERETMLQKLLESVVATSKRRVEADAPRRVHAYSPKDYLYAVDLTVQD